MTDVSALPILFLDVDGPLNPFAAPRARPPAGYQIHWMKPPTWLRNHASMPERDVPSLRVWLNPGHGARLVSLGYQLVWATTWAHDANEWIGPHIGLPELPVVAWPEDHGMTSGGGVHWKTRHLVEWAAGRPFAWVDDEITHADRVWVPLHHPAGALLHRVDPAVGLAADDFTELRRRRADFSHR